MSKKKTFLSVARTVLEQAAAPLHTKEITERALTSGLLSSSGSTPAATMGAQLSMSVKRKGDSSDFVRVAPGTFGLRRWIQEGSMEPPPRSPGSSRTGLTTFLPRYSRVQAALPVLDGTTWTTVAGMRRNIDKERGTRGENKDWSRPEEWIVTLLKGDEAAFASKLWRESEGLVNPRHFTGIWALVRRHGLVRQDGPLVSVTDRGRAFVEDPAGAAVLEIDEAESVFKALSLVGELGPARKGDLIGPWRESLAGRDGKATLNYANHTLYVRLRNLRDRGLVELSGAKYSLTPSGLDWLDRADIDDSEGGSDTNQQILALVRAQKQEIRDALHEFLYEMDPYEFEGVVAQLLDRMGYDDAEVTPRGNDKGVDVVATIEMGITTVREVIQVKRARANIGRPVLDGLRGALHRFRADRGTIITTSGFSKGTIEAANEIGVAPITLIDGPKLVDLLIDNGIGVKKKPVEVWELDAESLLSSSDPEEEPTEEEDVPPQESTGRADAMLALWTRLLARARRKTDLHAKTSPGHRNWIVERRHGHAWNYVVNKFESRVEMYLNDPVAEDNKELFDGLHAQKSKIESLFGGPLVWQRLDDKRACRISHPVQGGWANTDDWPRMIDELIDAMCRLYRALSAGLA